MLTLHAVCGQYGRGLRVACGTPSNREARRLDDELRALEQSMKSLNSSATQVPQAKKESVHVPSLRHAAGPLPLLRLLSPLSFNALTLFYASDLTEIVQE